MVDKFLAARILTSVSTAASHLGLGPGKEVLYAHMFAEGVRANNLSIPPLYPIRGAANWSLLYLIMRIATETGAKHVLELGAGQSTLLLDAIASTRGLDVMTLETDKWWAAAIGAKVSHPVCFCPQSRRVVCSYECEAFDGYPEGKYDVAIVDGPLGSKRRSRWSSLEVLDRQLKDEFVVVFDDAERRGEQDTIKAFLKMRPKAKMRLIFSAKCQCLIFTPNYTEVGYF